jgi:hypothetical protein
MRTKHAAEEIHDCRSTRKALEIVERAHAAGMDYELIAEEIGAAYSTIRMWRSNPDAVIALPTARRLRRLARRIGR